MNPFLQLSAEKKDSKNGAARKDFGPSYFVTALAVAVDVDREKDKDCKQLVHMADSHMTCKQCGLALSRRKNNMTFLAHKLLTLLFHQIEPLKKGTF